MNKCVKILLDSKQIPEAAIFCRTYCPSLLSEVLPHWNEKLNQVDHSQRTLIKILNPIENMNKDKIEFSERIIQDYYTLSNSASFLNFEKLSEFQNFDIEEAIDQGLNIDLNQLLEIDEKNDLKENEIVEESEGRTVQEQTKPIAQKLINAYDDEEEEEY